MSESQRPPNSPGKTPAGHSREITYRVGWKSGTIRMKEHAGPQAATEPDFLRPRKRGAAAVRPDAGASAPAAEPPGAFVRLMLRRAPLPPPLAWRYILFVLPALTFAVSCWLAYRMSSFE